MTLAQAYDAWPKSASEARGSSAAAVPTFGTVLLGAAFLPPIYGFVAFHGDFAKMMNAPVLQHVAFNCLANGVVVLAALRLAGRIDQQLAQVFSRVLLAHGALAILTLVFRHYYSIPMLMTGIVSSTVLGVVAMYAGHRDRKMRIGVLGPRRPAIAASGLGWERIENPMAPLRDFDLLLIAYPDEVPRQWSRVVSRALLAGKRVRHLSEYMEETRGVVEIEHFNLDHLPAGGATSYRVGKRLMDILVVIFTLPFTLPILSGAAVAVLATMGRPIFFRQPRVGQGGGVFTMMKLRTMRLPKEAELGVATLKNDSRITPLGRWLRRFHLDELPQLWNVLIGQMSLVGPRPEQPGLAETYARQAPAFAYRHFVRPGITGWAQVRAGYAADLAETRVKLGYDLYYLKNFSFALDVQILTRTVWTIVSGGGVR